MIQSISVGCEMDDWTDWSICSKTCDVRGQGLMKILETHALSALEGSLWQKEVASILQVSAVDGDWIQFAGSIQSRTGWRSALYGKNFKSYPKLIYSMRLLSCYEGGALRYDLPNFGKSLNFFEIQRTVFTIVHLDYDISANHLSLTWKIDQLWDDY